jgi:hypothetical protein
MIAGGQVPDLPADPDALRDLEERLTQRLLERLQRSPNHCETLVGFQSISSYRDG